MPDITDAELANLQARAAAADSAAAALDQSTTELGAARQAAQTATTALIDATRAANPTIPPDLIAGDTPEAIAASVDAGRTIVEQVKATTTTTPANTTSGTPPRPTTPQLPDTARGSERIRFGLDRLKESNVGAHTR